ncbi:MAG TPA: hypothetical protein VHQ90_10565 [Thermoanaerobaculia bacterium]|nr:hypothetical protein [Thermoanaerobaculia bacterium]
MSEHHPDREALEQFFDGRVAGGEERRIGDHLRSGCAVCQSIVDELVRQLDPTVTVEIAAARPRPRESPARAALEGRARRQRAEDDAWDLIFAKLEKRVALILFEKEMAPRLVAELLGAPAAERRRHVHEGRRFQTLAVCDLLIEKSFEAGFRDPAQAVSLAELAIVVADHLDGKYYGAAVAFDMKSRAWAFLGNARRIGSDLSGAERALALAESLAEEGSADPLEEARRLDLKASLLSDRGHFVEAAEVLDDVIEIYDDVKDLHRKGRALISKGLFLGYAGLPEQAVELIPQGLSLIDWEHEPRLVLMARHNFAWFLNEGGKPEKALQYIERFRGSYQQFPDFWTDFRLSWLEARIAINLGRHVEAEEKLRELQRCSAEKGLGYEASMVMLNLASLYLKQGRCRDLEELMRELLDMRVAPRALAALTAFQEASDSDSVTLAKMGEILSLLEQNLPLNFQKAA